VDFYKEKRSSWSTLLDGLTQFKIISNAPSAVQSFKVSILKFSWSRKPHFDASYVSSEHWRNTHVIEKSSDQYLRIIVGRGPNPIYSASKVISATMKQKHIVLFGVFLFWGIWPRSKCRQAVSVLRLHENLL